MARPISHGPPACAAAPSTTNPRTSQSLPPYGRNSPRRRLVVAPRSPARSCGTRAMDSMPLIFVLLLQLHPMCPYAGESFRVVGRISGRTIAAVGPGEDSSYLLLKASLTASTVGPSVAGVACTGMRSSSTCIAPSGFDEISRYQRPLWPRTERTKTSSSTTTTQMIVRCSGESPSRRVSMYTSLVSSRILRVSVSKESFTVLLFVAFFVDYLAEGLPSLPAAGTGSADPLVGVAEGDRCPHHLLLWYAE